MADCYAKCLGDCGGRVSHEHVVSDGVLALIANAKGKLLVSGLSWIKDGQVKELMPSALTTRCLCEAHNSYLSKYDSAAIKFFSALRAVIRAAHRGDASANKEVSVDANLVAGWLLKRYLGHASSDQFRRSDGQGAAQLDVEEDLIRILFGRDAWPSSWLIGIATSSSMSLDTADGGSLILDVGHSNAGKNVGVMEVTFDGVPVRFFRVPPSAKELATVALAPVRLCFVHKEKSSVVHTVMLAVSGSRSITEVTSILTGVDAPA